MKKKKEKENRSSNVGEGIQGKICKEGKYGKWWNERWITVTAK